ncbi:ABC-2 transporter permease [Lysinibacillus sp. 3P01SB]|uniref:ABC-2 transporter permease n=1 Tax=Lysinibacillus sp. 3P01SB TaxID=3132284 RepID=UPI0039A55705
MKAMLHLQYGMNKRSLLIRLVGLAIVGLIFMHSSSEISIPIFAFVSCMGAARSITLLKDKNTRILVHSFPIERKTIVTGTYIPVLLHVFMIYALLSPFQVFKGQEQGDLHNFLIPYIGLFAATIAYAALDLRGIFKGDPSLDSMTDSLLISFGTLFSIMLPHCLLCWWDHEPSFYIRLLVFPTISIMLFYWSLKKSIRLYETKEII